MTANILRNIKDKIGRAKMELGKLNTLITVMENAGEDITALKIERDNLSDSIDRWETAIKDAEETLK